jgi:hypothetical protein
MIIATGSHAHLVKHSPAGEASATTCAFSSFYTHEYIYYAHDSKDYETKT